MIKVDRTRAFENLRTYFRAFTSAFTQLATECNNTEGVNNIKLKFGTGCSVVQNIDSNRPEQSSIVLTMPDPITTLHLDRCDVNDPGFRAITGPPIHEVAHLMFGSLEHMRHYRGGDPYEATACNLLLDLCDEEALLTNITPAAYPPIAQMNRIIYSKIVTDPKQIEERKPSTHAAMLLVCAYHKQPLGPMHTGGAFGILQSSSIGSAPANKEAATALSAFAARYKVDMTRLANVYAKVRECLDSALQESVPPVMEDGSEPTMKLTTMRGPSFEYILRSSVPCIADFLRCFDQDDTPTTTPDTSDAPAIADPSAPPSDQPPQPNPDPNLPEDPMSDARQAVVQMLRAEKEENPSKVIALGADDQPVVQNKWVTHHRMDYRRYRSAIRRLMEQLLRSRKFTLCKPAMRGAWVRDVERVYTDGRIFIRRTDIIRPNASIAFIIDCSGSTQRYVDKLLAFSGFLAEGAREAGAACAAWVFGSTTLPMPVRMLGRCSGINLGGTVLSPALEEANTWLSNQHEDYKRRICVVLTDGQPGRHDVPRIMGQYEELMQTNTTLIVGCIRSVSLEDFVRDLCPRATTFNIGSNFGISALTLARKIGEPLAMFT